jgi:flavin reductase (DIM6/NTAB) family NADH-FMN oxidoreductase RutF
MLKVNVPVDHWDAMFAPSSCAAIITTVDSAGNVNAATFGTCTRVIHEPVHVLFATTAQPLSDTYSNVCDSGQFVVNPLSFDDRLLEQARIVGFPFRKEVNELERAGLSTAPALVVDPPRVADCKSHFECEVAWTKTFLDRAIVCGRVVAVSIDEDCYDPKGLVVWEKLRPAHYAGAPYGGNFVPAYEAHWVARRYDGPRDWRPGLPDIEDMPDTWPLGASVTNPLPDGRR